MFTIQRAIHTIKGNNSKCIFCPELCPFFLTKTISSIKHPTHHNSTDSAPTSNLVCMKEVAIKITFCIAGIIYYTCNLVIDIQCTCYKNAFNKHF